MIVCAMSDSPTSFPWGGWRNSALGCLQTIVWLSGSMSALASVQLDIPPRRQWDNNNGYCGECSIQQIALFYGTYISQYRIREIIDPTQEQDVWVPENSGPIFEALRLKYDVWNSAQPTPQYQGYLVWAKSHLGRGHPIVIDVFVQGETDPAYDHIMPATGFVSPDTNTYHSSDTLVFNDNYVSTAYTRAFGSLYDTRAMSGNGAIYEYCIPRDIDYGVAVTGIKDTSGTALPVSLKVDRWNEPNISLGASPVQMSASIRVGSLIPGRAYALLRFNDYHSVPTNNFMGGSFSSEVTFLATNSTHALSDSFMSDATVVYRCVPALLALPRITSLRLVGSDVRVQFTTQSNRIYHVEYRNDLVRDSWMGMTSNLVGTGGTMTVTDTGGANRDKRFYRVLMAVP